MEVIRGKITNIDEQGNVTITAKYDNFDLLCKRKYKDVEIGLNDGRTITPEQRQTIYALINGIAEDTGNLPDTVKYFHKLEFMTKAHTGLAKAMFSLSDCDVTLAREFTKYLIEFCLDWGIDLNFNLFEFIGDDNDLISHYVWACLKHKQCTCCGSKGELHHVDRIGMGNDRDEICHEGMEAMCLCRRHHDELHTIGDTKFYEKYHLDGGIPLDKELCKVWKVKAKKVVA
jgi:hypothetical protein